MIYEGQLSSLGTVWRKLGILFQVGLCPLRISAARRPGLHRRREGADGRRSADQGIEAVFDFYL